MSTTKTKKKAKQVIRLTKPTKPAKPDVLKSKKIDLEEIIKSYDGVKDVLQSAQEDTSKDVITIFADLDYEEFWLGGNLNKGCTIDDFRKALDRLSELEKTLPGDGKIRLYPEYVGYYYEANMLPTLDEVAQMNAQYEKALEKYNKELEEYNSEPSKKAREEKLKKEADKLKKQLAEQQARAIAIQKELERLRSV